MRIGTPLVVVLLFCSANAGTSPGHPRAARERPVYSVPGPGVEYLGTGGTSALAARETTGPDTFCLYGGPDRPTEGKFQLADASTPDWGGGNLLPGGYGGGPGAWTPVDLTTWSDYWHRDTFNAENLGAHGEGNRAMWCGLAADDPRAAGWTSAPGYGNNWYEQYLLYESGPVADPSAGQTVELDFRFNFDLEPGWDFLYVEYDSAGTWARVCTVTGTSADTLGVFAAPGARYGDLAERPITFAGNDYGGVDADRIRIRLSVVSDGAWSDEDGLYDTDGAAQIDDFTLSSDQGTFAEDYESEGPWLFTPYLHPFAGDFSDVYFWRSDPDPCRADLSPVLGFIDYGQDVRNGPGTNGMVSTGGSTSPGIEYGLPGSFVVNYTDGLRLGDGGILNEVWSPDIAWDLPGGDDDDPAVVGAYFRFSLWSHLPLQNGIGWTWHVRSALPGEGYSSWTDRDSGFHYGATPQWIDYRHDVSDLIARGAERVQLAVGCWDWAAIFGAPGTEATPAPVFDNVAFYKYRIAGPVMRTRAVDLAQGGFPPNGSGDAATPASRDALDVPFDMARDVNLGDFVIATGDSIVVDVSAMIPGTTVDDLRMVWQLWTNPLFEDAIRSAPSRARDENVVAGPAGTVWSGEVVGAQSTTSDGFASPDRFFFDLPDQDLLYPGDVLHYFIQATDSDGRVSTLPSDIDGFGEFDPELATYDRAFTLRLLPSLKDAAGARPSILVINDFGHRGGEDEWLMALRELGLLEGIDFDTYTVEGPTSSVSNGIGSAGGHGATAAQLAGYETIFYFAGDLNGGLLSNGDATLADNDKGDDLGVLQQWLALPGSRNLALFGDNIASAISNGSAEGAAFVVDEMGVNVLGADVRPFIGGQTAPVIVPRADAAWSAYFATEFVAYGGCLTLNTFDQIKPQPGGEAGHCFTDAARLPITDPMAGAASVIAQHPNGFVMTFPYSEMSVRVVLGRSVNATGLGQLFGEVLGLFGYAGASPPVDAPQGRAAVRLSATPNPFNPSTTIEFNAAQGAKGSILIYNLRGELVRTLLRGEFLQTRFRWDGTDDRGAAVASGVYLVRADDGVTNRTTKVALVR